MPDKNRKTKLVPWADVVQLHPWMGQFEGQGVRIVEDLAGTWRFEMNRIVNDLYDLHVVHGLGLNEITIRQQQNVYSYDELVRFAMQLGLSIGGFADMLPVCTRWTPKKDEGK